jgi:hypothetical protein
MRHRLVGQVIFAVDCRATFAASAILLRVASLQTSPHDSLSVLRWNGLRDVPSRLVPRARIVPLDILVARQIDSESEMR